LGLLLISVLSIGDRRLRRVIGLREDFGKGPGSAGVGGEGEVGAAAREVCSRAGDYAVSCVAERDGKDSAESATVGNWVSKTSQVWPRSREWKTRATRRRGKPEVGVGA